MDNVVYVDAMEKELDLILDGDKKMIIRGASGRKLPYGRIFEGDELYFIENNGDNLIKAKATNGGARRCPQRGRKSRAACKGVRALDCETENV
jgi:hypothetical protein